MKKLLLGIIIAFSLQSCSERMGMQSVENTKWVLIEWPGQIMPNSTKKATLDFGAAEKVSGKSFCNGFGGVAKIEGNKIKFSQLLGTLMFCEDVGTAEKTYTDGLMSVTNFKVINGKLNLLKDGETLMIFTKTQ